MLDRLERLEAEMREVRRRLDEFMPRREPEPLAPVDPMSLEPLPEDRRRR
jgi:hypothetical protein